MQKPEVSLGHKTKKTKCSRQRRFPHRCALRITNYWLMHGWRAAYNQMPVEFVVKPITNYNQNSVSVYIKSVNCLECLVSTTLRMV